MRKPAKHKKGATFLVYGESGSGKTMFALSFPKSAYFDAENGVSFYEGTEKGKNITGILETQSFKELDQQVESLIKEKKRGNEDFESIVIDSETKIYENLQEALLTIDEKRAREKGKDPLDANISVRSYGKIGQKSRASQNLKLRAATSGYNVVSIAQPKDVMEDLGNGKRIKTGEMPDMKKKAQFDYDVVLFFYMEDGRHLARVMKDRTGTFSKDEIVESPTYELWSDAINGRTGELLDSNYNADTQKTKDSYQNELTGEDVAALPLVEQIKLKVSKLSAKKKEKFAESIKEMDIKSLSKATDIQLTQVLNLLDKDLD